MSDSLQFPLNFFNDEDMVLQVTTYFVNPSAIGGGAVVLYPPSLCFFLINLKTVDIRTLKLLNYFSFIVVNKFC